MTPSVQLATAKSVFSWDKDVAPTGFSLFAVDGVLILHKYVLCTSNSAVLGVRAVWLCSLGLGMIVLQRQVTNRRFRPWRSASFCLRRCYTRSWGPSGEL